jgi:hypothetical protein
LETKETTQGYSITQKEKNPPPLNITVKNRALQWFLNEYECTDGGPIGTVKEMKSILNKKHMSF